MPRASTTRRCFLSTGIRAAASSALAYWAPIPIRGSSVPVAQPESSSGTEFISNIRESTISTDVLEDSVHFYREHFGFQVHRTANLKDDGWRSLWRLSSDYWAKAVLMQLPGQQIGSIRLVQFYPTPKVYAHLPNRSLTTGYGGLDIEVPDIDERFQGLVLHGHPRVNSPIEYVPPNSGQILKESVAVGPSGERIPMVIYRNSDNNSKPPAQTTKYSPVLAVFQVVQSLEIAQQPYLSLGLEITRKRDTSLPAVNRALGIPADTRYRAYQMSSNAQERFGRTILVEFVNKSVEDLSDISKPPNLGLIMTSYKVRDIEEAKRRILRGGSRIMAGPVKIDNPIYGSTVAMTVAHANGTWMEMYA